MCAATRTPQQPHPSTKTRTPTRRVWWSARAVVAAVVATVTAAVLSTLAQRATVHSPTQIVANARVFATQRAGQTSEKEPCSLVLSVAAVVLCLSPQSHYTAVLDAGSTGSRMHVYRFDECRCTGLVLRSERLKMLTPGLQAHATPNAAAESLVPLLRFAREMIPTSHWRCAPLAVYATAGLRMAGDEAAAAILRAVATAAAAEPFPVHAVAMMDGRDEGVFAWIALNYLLGSLGSRDTVAVMDLGGGSTQLVFEHDVDGNNNNGDDNDMAAVPDDHIYIFEYGTREITLYQHAWDGYGLVAARRAVPSCNDGFEACLDIVVARMFRHDSPRDELPAILRNLRHPPLARTPLDIYAFSFFWDVFALPFGHTDGSPVALGVLRDTARRCCDEGHAPPPERDPYRDDFCRDLTYIYALLSVGYNLPDSRTIITTKTVGGVESGWYLGAALAVIEQQQLGHECLFSQPALVLNDNTLN